MNYIVGMDDLAFPRLLHVCCTSLLEGERERGREGGREREHGKIRFLNN